MSLAGPSFRKSKPIMANHHGGGGGGVVVTTTSNGITGGTICVGSSSGSDSGNSNSTFTMMMGPGELCSTGDEGYNEVSSSTSNLTTNSTTTSSTTTTTSSSATRTKRVGSNENDDSGPPVKRRRGGEDRNGKGLRHFSMKVCQKVKDKGTTTYNEVADELVAEFSSESTGRHHGGDESNDGHGADCEVFDQKNIRRRVYDAFNVLMAMNIISKEKKVIKWLGLPTATNNPLSANSTGPGGFCHENNHTNRFSNNSMTSTNNPTITNNSNTNSSSSTICNNGTVELEKERQSRLERLSVKKERLRELMLQNIAVKSLIERNKRGPLVSSNAKINLPFIIVNTDRSTVIDCSINSEKTEYAFNFGNTFEIHDDAEILKRLGLTYGLQRNDLVQIDRTIYEKAKSLLPVEARPFLDELIEEKGAVIRS